MRPLNDYDVEMLFGSAPLPAHSLPADQAGVAAFLNALRDAGSDRGRSRPEMVARMAMAARAGADSHLSLVSAPAPRWASLLKPAIAAVACLVLAVGVSGVAYAANDARPGDALYGLDRALERVGIMDGHSVERLAEAKSLLESGETGAAFALLGDEIASVLEDDSDGEAVTLLAGLDDAVTSNSNAAEAAAKVALLHEFIDANKGKDVGLDGKEFGQAVAAIARGDVDTTTDPDNPVQPSGDDDDGNGNVDDPADDVAGNGNGTTNENGNVDGNGNANGNVDGNGNGNANSNAGGNGNGNSNAGGNGKGDGNGIANAPGQNK